MSIKHTWAALYDCLMKAIYFDGIRELGPAYHAAAAQFAAIYGPEDPVSRDYTELFILLGDPSMRLPDPPPDNYLIISAPDYVGSAPLDQFGHAVFKFFAVRGKNSIMGIFKGKGIKSISVNNFWFH